MKINPKVAIAFVLITALIALAFGLFSSNAEDNPEITVRNIYKNIYSEKSTISSLDAPETIYASTFLSLIRAEQQRQISTGELGNLSADPLCNCQDPSAIEVIGISAQNTELDKATVSVDLLNSEIQETITLDLIKENGRWMVSDVRTEDLLSLKNTLIAE